MPIPEEPDYPHPSSAVEEAFASYLGRIEAGEPLSFDEFCSEHPEQEQELRRLHRDWRQVAGVLERLGLSGNLTARLERTLGGVPHTDVRLETEGPAPSAEAFSSEVLKRLSGRKSAFGRYRLKGEVGRGGMGAILRIWDEDLRRHLAMKVVLGRGEPAGASDTPAVDSRTLGRFLEEAQVTAQLDHPGIVPVHELGLDAEGRVYFTMKLVKGQTLKEVFQRVQRGEPDWTQARALGSLSKVCDAMAYAHAKGVVHRDLKPANIMVGRYGETYVMDWGLAHVLGETDHKDLRIEEESFERSGEVRSDRRDMASRGVDELRTRDGDALGTPAYMPPEQARGELHLLGPRADVYAVGAMLYHLLAGHAPYTPPAKGGRAPRALEILRKVCAGPPPPLAQVAPATPPELAAVCAKAMAHDPNDRYEDMGALADELRRYLELRVVRAYRTGPLAELKQWMLRNKAVAGLLAALVIVLVTAGFAVAWKERQRREETQLRAAAGLVERIEAERTSVPSSARELEELRAELEQFVSLKPGYERELADLERRLALEPRSEPDAFVRGKEARLAFVDFHLAAFRGLRERLAAAPDLDADELAVVEARLTQLGEERERLGWLDRHPLRQVPTDASERTRHEYVARFVILLRWLETEGRWSVEHALAALAAEADAASQPGVMTWDEASPRIERAYDFHRRLPPQAGLVPLGPDPESGLWLFLAAGTGRAPEVRDGKWVLTAATGVVLVLIPGGDFTLGREGGFAVYAPPRQVSLEPYFLSKYELTQGQAYRMSDANPSHFAFGDDYVGMERVTLLHPVENLSYLEAERILHRHGLEPPTEAQWEYACRAGTAGLTWWDPAADPLDVNLGRGVDPWPKTARVDLLAANPWGLHGMFGNVWEWCRDAYVYTYADARLAAGSGELLGGRPDKRPIRGSTYKARATDEVSATTRAPKNLAGAVEDLGVRPARTVKW